MDEKLVEMIKYLRMPGLTANWDHYLKVAQKGNFSHVRFLKYLLEEEYKIKKEKSRLLRVRRARVPEKLIMETFPFHNQPKLNRKKVLAIYDAFDYVTKNHNVIWIGPTGTGKTGLATAFLMQALERGFSGRFILFPELIELMYKSVADHSEAKVLKTFAAYDSLLIDELGYVEVEPVQVGLFFNLMQRRHKRKTTLITSNLGFAEWTTFLKNEQLTAALIDRLTENSHIINMKKCTSLRPRLDQL